jgi:hypothetical protein
LLGSDDVDLMTEELGLDHPPSRRSIISDDLDLGAVAINVEHNQVFAHVRLLEGYP